MPTYLVTITVKQDESYTETAGSVVNALSNVMSDSDTVEQIVGEFESANSEVGVCLEGEQVVARMVVRITCSLSKAIFDKPKFTSALKNAGLSAFKVSKKAMSDEEVAKVTEEGQSPDAQD